MPVNQASPATLGVDASTAKVQAKGKCRKGYPWVVVADRDHVLFNFSARHSSDVPRELLRGFRGFVLADASSVYDRLFAAEDAPIEAGCWAHARRGFFYAAPADERALVGLGLADQPSWVVSARQTMRNAPSAHRLAARRS